MKIAFLILIGIHGLIHLIGFFKGFGIAEFSAITQPISKTQGLFWLMAVLFFCISLVQLASKSEYWWGVAFLAVVFSQGLIIANWTDTKFGTVANGIILGAAVIGFARTHFNTTIEKEQFQLLKNSQTETSSSLPKNDPSNLPPIVQTWLFNSGALDKPMITSVYLEQELQLKLRPDQTTWYAGRAEQYFTTQPPAFNWNIRTSMNKMLPVVGRDKFVDGKGEMLIKLFSLIPVADAKNEEKVNQATLQRYLAEIVWFPSAALQSYISWETINDHSAKATLSYMGTKGEGVFHFDAHGNFKKFVAQRYQDAHAETTTEWVVVATKIEEQNGIKVPVACEASWQLAAGQWTWLKLKIKSIQFNVTGSAASNQ